ncbi:MAG: alanine racemase [Aquabacterium sp.]
MTTVETTIATADPVDGAHPPASAACAAELGPWLKGWPIAQGPLPLATVGAQGWHLLDGTLPLPLAVLRRDALHHNLQWMQDFAAQRGIDMAPHGKTTMSPQLFRAQLAAGAWGITFANPFQLAVGIAAGVRRAVIANQVHMPADLAALAHLHRTTPGLRSLFLVDSAAQLAQIEAWHAARPAAPVFEVLLELGIPGGRTGVRDDGQALALARALRASPAVALAGIECYEGLRLTGDGARDLPHVGALMQRLHDVAARCEAEDLFEADEVIVSAGGSAVFDLVAAGLRPPLRRPVRALLRSGCYVTHDHGHYRRLVEQVRLRCGCADALEPALEVWTAVQSVPEPGLALLSAGRRDVSFDIEMPHVVAWAPAGSLQRALPPAGWQIKALNDQHAYLRWDSAAGAGPAVGDRVGLGISHPCTTFDKWHWMAVLDADDRVVDAVTVHF